MTMVETTTENVGLDMGTRGEPTEYVDTYQFDVEEQKVVTNEGLIIPNMRAIVRSDTSEVIGTVGSHYKVLTHAEALDPILDGFKKKGIETFKRITMADNGAKMFANIYFPGSETEIGKRDNVWPGVSVVNSLDGSLNYLGEISLYRLACTNGMRVPHRLAGFSARHSKNKNYDEMINQIIDAVDEGSHFNTFARLANQGFKLDGVEGYIDNLLEDKKFAFPKRYKSLVLDEINNGKYTFNTITLWDIYNAFQSVLEHNLIREKGKLQRARVLEDNLYNYFDKYVTVPK